jgi:hypothetical protein
MQKTIFFFLGFIMLFSACKKEPITPNPSTDIIIGKIDNILQATDNINNFLLILTKPNDEQWEAMVDDTTKMKLFEIGKSAALKGKVVNKLLDVQKIISTDTKNFVIKGIIQSITDNEGGYQAEILGNDEETYFAEISISNLGENYQTLSVGDSTEIRGELWKIDSKLQITVKEIIK